MRLHNETADASGEGALMTFYLVIGEDGLEGSFATMGDAEGYLAELRDIGVRGLYIQTKTIAEA